MQPIPQKLKNVSVYIALEGPVIGRSLDPIIKNATAEYSVGTLITNIFYNLDILQGDIVDKPKVHLQYIATGETENGTQVTTPWMYCLETGATPKFGRTIRYNLAEPSDAPSYQVSESPYITLAPLTDITVSQLFPPPAIGQTLRIENGSGNIIATRVGTPHEMGVEVRGGERFGPIAPGSKRYMITGKTKEGKLYSVQSLTAVSGGDPAIFLRMFPD